MPLSDSRRSRRQMSAFEDATLAAAGLPRLPGIAFQTCRAHYPGGSDGCSCRFFPVRAAFPVFPAGRHPRLHFRDLLRLHSRYGPPDRSTAFAAFVTRLQHGQSPNHAARQLPDHRLLSGWILPPLVIRAVGAHGKITGSFLNSHRILVSSFQVRRVGKGGRGVSIGPRREFHLCPRCITPVGSADSVGKGGSAQCIIPPPWPPLPTLPPGPKHERIP